MNRYQEAKNIYNKSKFWGVGDGTEIVSVLLKDRVIDELSEEEFWLLTRGYNWAMKDLEALEASKVAIRKFPQNVELLHSHWDYMYNCYCDDSPHLIEKAKENIKLHLGEPAFWYLCMAEEAVDLAYIEDKEEDYEWYQGRPVQKQIWLDKAERYLSLAVDILPELLEGKHPYDYEDCTWQQRFEGLLSHGKYSALRRKNDF